MLQQYLPFTVLKQMNDPLPRISYCVGLQQYLPFTVLKPNVTIKSVVGRFLVATVLTVYGIETFHF